jgi:hypothetical protein
MSKRLAVLTGLLVPLVIWAGDAVLPNTFSPGTLIKSSELNANFEALRDAVNAKSAGTRLKTIRVSSSDGFAQEVGLSAAGITPVWDSLLSISCRAAKVAGAGVRCVPAYSSTGYSDAACTHPIAYLEHAGATVGAAIEYLGGGTAPTESPQFAFDDQTGVFHRVGAATGSSNVYIHSGSCFLSSVQAPTYELGAVEPASTFALLQVGLR